MRLFFIALLAGVSAYAAPPLPQRDLTVELRQMEDTYGEPSGYTVSSHSGSGLSALSYQKIMVRNGEKASVKMAQSTPKQWVQSVSGASSTTSNTMHGATNMLEWLQSGYSITVLPRWTGSDDPATVEFEVEQKDLQTHNNADMPTQARRQFSSTITAPLAQWVTISSAGEVPKAGVYSTSSANKANRQALQIRVLAP